MPVTRLGSAALLTNTLSDVGKTQEKLATMQMQISSGYKSNNFEGLNGSVERFSLLQSQQQRVGQFLQENAVAKAQLENADNALGNMVTISTSLSNLMVQARSPSGNSLSFEQQANDLLTALGVQLNTTSAGQYIFGGTNTASPPAPDLTVPTVVTGVPDDGYYKGSKQNTVLSIDDNSQFQFPVRADDIAFQQIIAAVHQAVDAYNGKNDAGMASALDLMQKGQTALTGARAKVESSLVNVGDTTTRLTSLNLYLKGITDNISATDTVAVTTEIANYQAILQATFQVYSRLSQLRLSDYLK